jgi:hypothetical protein
MQKAVCANNIIEATVVSRTGRHHGGYDVLYGLNRGTVYVSSHACSTCYPSGIGSERTHDFYLHAFIALRQEEPCKLRRFGLGRDRFEVRPRGATGGQLTRGSHEP